MSYSIARLLDPYRGIFDIIGTVSDYEEAWRRAGSARRLSQHICFVLGTETREDPELSTSKARTSDRSAAAGSPFPRA